MRSGSIARRSFGYNGLMGIHHGLAGQFAKSEAAKKARTIFATVLASVIVGVGATCYAAGFMWHRAGGISVLVGLVVVAALFCASLYGWRRIEPHMEAMAKRRIMHLRGGQAEALIAAILGYELSDDWHIFNGIQLTDDSDHDHVIVGPGGVFCVSTKSQRGLFVGTDAGEGLLWNNEPSAFAKQAMSQALRLRERLAALLGADVPFVQPVLAAALGFTQGDALGGKVWLVHADSITDRLERAPRRLSGGQLARVVDAVAMLQSKAAAVYRRPAATASATPAR